MEQGKIELKWIRSAENIADVFTKPLSRQMFEKVDRGRVAGWPC